MSITSMITAAGLTAIPHIIENKVIPALTNLTQSVKKGFEFYIEPTGKHFEQYLSRTYEKHSVLNTLVFHNQQKQLRDLYIPLTLVPEGISEKKNKEAVIIDGYPKDFIMQYRRVLITDTAGMGKSTLTKIMFLSAIDQEAGIPFYIELRRLSKTHLLLDEIRDQLGSLTKEFDNSLMCAFFQSGGFIFFFDGFDEVGLNERKEVTEDIKRFVEKAPENYYIMTSRYEQALAGFGDFRSMKIRPLVKNEAYSLLRKYDSEGDTSKRLIEKLNAGDYRKISTFLQNPLLVSLLFIGFEYKPEIPLKIHLFYDQVFEAYFNNHDLSKDGYYTHEKESGLDMADFGKVLRAIGYICLTKHRLEFNRNDFLEILEKAGKLSCISLKSSEALMHDLLHAVPLFYQDGVDYKWVHKSMQEYFAADFINRDCGIKKEQILLSLAHNPEINNYMNLLELYSDLDSKSFLQYFVLPVLDDFIDYIEKPISINNPEMEGRIKRRRQIIYGRDLYVYLFPKGERNIPISEAFDILRSKVDARPTHSVISHLGLEKYRGAIYIAGNNDRIATLIARKYPQVKSSLKDYHQIDPMFLECGRLYHIDEMLMIDNPEAYDEINTFSFLLSHPNLEYDQVIKLRKEIMQTLNENEDVFKDLLVL